MRGSLEIGIHHVQSQRIGGYAEQHRRQFGFNCGRNAHIVALQVHENQAIHLAGAGKLADGLHAIGIADEQQIVAVLACEFRKLAKVCAACEGERHAIILAADQ